VLEQPQYLTLAVPSWSREGAIGGGIFHGTATSSLNLEMVSGVMLANSDVAAKMLAT
jgi:hypothetical protein